MTIHRVWPSTNGPTQSADDSSAYTMGMQFVVTANCMITAIYFWRAPKRWDGSDTQLGDPFITQCGIFDADTHLLVLPAESFFDPGSATGWRKRILDTPIPVDTTHVYKVAVFGAPTGYAASPNFWDLGDGAAGITSGILHAQSGAEVGANVQDTFNTSATPMQYPTGAFNAGNYWIDVEVESETPASPLKETSGTGPWDFNSFAPNAGSGYLVTVALNPDGSGTAADCTVDWASGGVGTWQKLFEYSPGGFFPKEEYWYVHCATAPGVSTIRVTPNAHVAGGYAIVTELIGEDPLAPLGATASSIDNTQSAISITPTVSGSRIYGINVDTFETFTPAANTDSGLVSSWNDPGGREWWAVTNKTATVAGTPIAVGLSNTGLGSNFASAIEIVPPSGVPIIPSGSVVGTLALAGTVDGEKHPFGSVVGTLLLAGAVDGATNHEGNVSGTLTLAGIADGVKHPRGAVHGTFLLAGGTDGEADYFGHVSGTLTLAGSVDGTKHASGSVSGTLVLAGQVGGLGRTVKVWTGIGWETVEVHVREGDHWV